MAQEIFEEEMGTNGERPLLYDGENIRIIKFDEMNLATVIHKDNVIAKRGENKGLSRSKWEILGYHSNMKAALSRVLEYTMSEELVSTHGEVEKILLTLNAISTEIISKITVQ